MNQLQKCEDSSNKCEYAPVLLPTAKKLTWIVRDEPIDEVAALFQIALPEE